MRKRLLLVLAAALVSVAAFAAQWNAAGDTLTLTEADLPYTHSGKVGEQKVIALTNFTGATFTLINFQTEGAFNEEPDFVNLIDGSTMSVVSPLPTGFGYLMGKITKTYYICQPPVANQVNPGKAFTLTIAGQDDIKAATAATITTTPITEAGVLVSNGTMPTEPLYAAYQMDYAGNTRYGIMAVVASYEITPNGTDYYELICKGGAKVAVRSTSEITEANYTSTYSAQPTTTDKIILDVIAPSAGYSIEFRTGATSSVKFYDLVEAKEITLPYRGTAQCTQVHQMAITDATTSEYYYTYDLYKFKVAEKGKTRLRYESNDDVLFNIVYSTGKSKSYRAVSNVGDNTLVTITPDEYCYIALLGKQGAKADFSFSLEPETTEQVVMGDTAFLPGDRMLTIDKTYYGQLVPHDTLLNSSEYFSDGATHAVAHYLDIKEGALYSITVTMNAGCSKEQNEVQVIVLDSLNNVVNKGYSTDIDKNKLTTTIYLVNSGRYKVLVAGYVQLTPRDYTILVEPYSMLAEYGFTTTMLTIPFALDSTILASDIVMGENPTHFFQINNIPTTDTTVVMKWKTSDKNLEGVYFEGIADNIFTEEREFEITTILEHSMASGVPYTLFGFKAEGYGNYHLEMRYSDRSLSNTTAITLAELLAAAEQVSSLAEQRILFGAEPSKLVTGNGVFMNNGSEYYAQAYKVQVAAGQYIHATMSEIANGSYPAIRIFKKDNAGNITKEAEGDYNTNLVVATINEGDEYYVVFTSENTMQRGNSLVSISVGQSPAASTITFAELIAAAEEVASSATISKEVNFGTTESKYVQGETDLFGDDATAQYYAVAYKAALAANTALVTQSNQAQVWIYKYDEGATTAAKVTKVYESSLGNKNIIYEEGIYYVVFSTSDFEQTEINIATRAITAKESIASVAIDITLPYTDSVTLGNAIVVDGEVFGYTNPVICRIYKVSLTEGQSIAFAADYFQYAELYLVTDVDNFTTGGSTPDYLELSGNGGVAKIVTSGDYYLVVYYEIYGGEFTVEATTTYTSEEIVELAEPLPGIRGKVQIEPSELIAEAYSGTNLYWNKIYKVELKQGANFRMKASGGFSTDVYRKKANGTFETGYSNTNPSYSDFLLVDEDATYYLMIYSGTKPEEAIDFSWEISLTPDEYIALASETATTLPAEITANIEEFVTPLVAFADDNLVYMDAQPQRLALKQDDILAIIKNNNGASLAEYYKNQHAVINIENDGTTTTLANTSNWGDAVSVVTAGAGTNYFTGQAYDVSKMIYKPGERTYMLRSVELNVDSVLKHADVLSMNSLPMVDEGNIYDLIMNKCIWFTNSLTIARAYQITLNKSDIAQIAFTSNYFSTIEYDIYRNGVKESEGNTLANEETTIVYGTAEGDVVTILFRPTVKLLTINYNKLIKLKEYNYNITISNPYQVSTVTALDAVDNIEVDDYTNESEIRLTLAELDVVATLQSGTTQNMAKYTTWTLDEDLTQAVGTVTLPRGYAFADGVENTVTLLINPVTISTSVDGNGTITPSATKVVRRGTKLTYTIVASEGYEIKSLTANGSEVEEAAAQTEYTYTFTAKKDTRIKVVFVAQSTGIEQVAANDFTLYTHERTIVIEDAAMNATVRIYSLTGNLIYAGHITATAEQYQMPIAGLYIVRVGNKVQKAIVK